MSGDESDKDNEPEKVHPIFAPRAPLSPLEEAFLSTYPSPGVPEETHRAIPENPFDATTEENFRACITPREALARYGLSQTTAILQLNRELSHGRVEAVAEEVRWGPINGKLLAYPLIPTWVWLRHDLKPEDDFWDTGYLYSHFPSQGYSVVRDGGISFFYVRFWPHGLPNAIEPPSEAAPASMPTAAGKGGRPRKGWWDDLWIEMIRRIEAGNLHPTSAAQLQKKMEDWLGENQIYPGDSTLKPMANKLFKYLQERQGET
ncbi:hypothetical protein [Sphingopyxis sp. QXT-31]|uniref:hypothetical protein n=1 Tax=Sphingopyxis sp. QXT-31 TaxID=1357916 RepID=UPI0012EC4360|nr:hypothetical protein [Sphingopyxis sp. QXT-31]